MKQTGHLCCKGRSVGRVFRGGNDSSTCVAGVCVGPSWIIQFIPAEREREESQIGVAGPNRKRVKSFVSLELPSVLKGAEERE